jgi:hypothetical protein
MYVCMYKKNIHVDVHMCIYIYAYKFTIYTYISWCDLLELSILPPGSVFIVCMCLKCGRHQPLVMSSAVVIIPSHINCKSRTVLLLINVIPRSTPRDMTGIWTWVCSLYHRSAIHSSKGLFFLYAFIYTYMYRYVCTYVFHPWKWDDDSNLHISLWFDRGWERQCRAATLFESGCS